MLAFEGGFATGAFGTCAAHTEQEITMADAFIENNRQLLNRILIELGAGQEPSGHFEQIDAELLCTRLYSELNVAVTKEEIGESGKLSVLGELVLERLQRDTAQMTIVDILGGVELIAKTEIHSAVQLCWYRRWVEFDSLGTWLTAPDWLDYVEMFMRFEEEFGVRLKVTSQSIEAMPETVGETVKIIWQQTT